MAEKKYKLSQAKIGTKVKVQALLSSGLIRRRMLDLGIIQNSIIYVLRRSPWGDPTAYIIKDTCIALRKEESDEIIVSDSIAS